MQAGGLQAAGLGWAGQHANGHKAPAAAPIETDAAGLGWGWLGWAGQDANGVKGPAVAPIETLQTAARRPRFLQAGGLQAAGLAWGWLGWAGQNVEATYEAGCGPY